MFHQETFQIMESFWASFFQEASEQRNWLLFIPYPYSYTSYPLSIGIIMHCLSVQCTSVMLKLMLLSKCYMTFYLNYVVKPANAHLLSHLAKYVWLWGSLWMHSTFVSENLDFAVIWVATMILGVDADGTQKFLK